MTEDEAFNNSQYRYINKLSIQLTRQGRVDQLKTVIVTTKWIESTVFYLLFAPHSSAKKTVKR